MIPTFIETAVAMLIAIGGAGPAAARPILLPLGPTAVAGADSLPGPISGRDSLVLRLTPPLPPGRFPSVALPAQDTLRRRQKAYEYSDGYSKRLTLHRRMSYAMLPLFAASYFSGDKILEQGRNAPGWARSIHRPSATASAVLFGVNSVTGGWNLWESRRDPNGRKRRYAHALLFTAASAGFVYAGTTLADEAEQSQDKRLQHRNVNLASMGVSTASWLLMLLRR
ncbi:MAG TPA: hypothetical protein VE869_12235 [Gemmatimonas sp.]|nr:hypothetical protein [Gemmatimonas sp.]